MDITIKLKVAEAVGLERAFLLEYVLNNKEEDGWTPIGIGEYRTHQELHILSSQTMYYHIQKLVTAGYLERRYSNRRESSRIRLTRLGKSLMGGVE